MVRVHPCLVSSLHSYSSLMFIVYTLDGVNLYHMLLILQLTLSTRAGAEIRMQLLNFRDRLYKIA